MKQKVAVLTTSGPVVHKPTWYEFFWHQSYHENGHDEHQLEEIANDNGEEERVELWLPEQEVIQIWTTIDLKRKGQEQWILFLNKNSCSLPID